MDLFPVTKYFSFLSLELQNATFKKWTKATKQELWCETNDGIYWVQKSRKLKKGFKRQCYYMIHAPVQEMSVLKDRYHIATIVN